MHPLYEKTIPELRAMAAARGTPMTNWYPPYRVEPMQAKAIDVWINYNFEDWDHRGYPEKENELITIYNIKTTMGVFRRFLKKENADKDCEMLNKRNLICIIESENPLKPVFL